MLREPFAHVGLRPEPWQKMTNFCNFQKKTKSLTLWKITWELFESSDSQKGQILEYYPATNWLNDQLRNELLDKNVDLIKNWQ